MTSMMLWLVCLSGYAAQNADFNQYWYSPRTIRAMADEVEASGGHAAFLSTPSVYFTVDKKIRETCKVFDVRGATACARSPWQRVGAARVPLALAISARLVTRVMIRTTADARLVAVLVSV